MRILALDQSLTRSGWAVLDKPDWIAASGWFASKGGDTRDRVDAFKDHVRQLILDYEPEVLAWERPATFRSLRANLVGARLDEALVGLAAAHGLKALSVASATWRAKVLGKTSGRLTSDKAKEAALQYCRWIGLAITDHNAAEAVCIGRWASTLVEPPA